MSLAQVCDMFDVCLTRNLRSCGLESTNTELNAVLGHHLMNLTTHIVKELFNIEYPIRLRCFELSLASEHDCRGNCIGR